MKKQPNSDLVMLTPAADGWLLHLGATPPQAVATIEDASALAPAGSALHLALPCRALVIEGLKLPATQRDELAGMVRLQLEKTLPYPLDEVSSDFVTVESSGTESSIISFAVPHLPLETMCQSLRAQKRLPEKITPFVLHVAAACPAHETVLAVYPEQGQLVLAICDLGKLRWAHVVADMDAAHLSAELPHVFLAASMEGAPTAFSRILLAAECRVLDPVFQATFPVPVESLPDVGPALADPINLVPASWRSDAQQLRKARKLHRNLQMVAAIYVLAAVGIGLYLAQLHRQVARLQAQVRAAQPQLELLQSRQARSNALAPAIEPARFTVELLFLLHRALPDRAIRITEFDQQPDEWSVTGEAPTAGLAIDYAARVKADPDLGAYQIVAGPPQLLPNEHARFNIFGKR